LRDPARVDAVSGDASDLVLVSDEVREALAGGRAVVALETTLVAHGFPAPAGIEVGLASDEAVRSAGATPATIGVLDGRIRVGLTPDELARFTSAARKTGPRDLAACAVRGDTGGTTVGGALAVAAAVGIRFLGTGGIGGVHRGFPPPDVSADIPMLARVRALVVSSGVKSLLDVPATVEVLETLGVPVLGFRTDTLPLFYAAAGGPPVPQRIEEPSEAAGIAAAHWELGGAGVLLANPPPESIDAASLIEEAVAEAAAQGVSGQAVTPFVLSLLHERSGGRTREVNRTLVVANARLAGETAVAYGAL
jgi:pseudouridine-5'-phosphate glycosidase